MSKTEPYTRRLTIGEKKEIVAFMKSEQVSQAKTALFFSKKFNLKINRNTIYRLNKNMDTYQNLNDECNLMKYLVSTIPSRTSEE